MSEVLIMVMVMTRRKSISMKTLPWSYHLKKESLSSRILTKKKNKVPQLLKKQRIKIKIIKRHITQSFSSMFQSEK